MDDYLLFMNCPLFFLISKVTLKNTKWFEILEGRSANRKERKNRGRMGFSHLWLGFHWWKYLMPISCLFLITDGQYIYSCKCSMPYLCSAIKTGKWLQIISTPNSRPNKFETTTTHFIKIIQLVIRISCLYSLFL